MDKWVRVSVWLLGLVFIAGVIIWSCIYFIIYYPLLRRSWTQATCTVTEVRDFRVYSLMSTEIQVYTAVIYSNNSRIGEGYGCASTASEAAISRDAAAGHYPYQYMECDISYVSGGPCKEGELLQPAWFCVDYGDRGKYQVGSSVECQYDVNGETQADNYTHPQEGGDFIEVLFKDEVYIPMADYIALWVCAFGFMCVLPCVLCCIGLVFPLGWCSYDEREKYRDFYYRFLCCQRKKLPGCIEARGKLESKIPPAPVIVWLRTVKSQRIPLKTALVREVADYLI